jgi:TRAP-type C4-dicarboxylate transport system substrate-binding protein
MTDTTTIEITQAQKEALDELKEHSRESYKSVIAQLLDEGVNTTEVIPVSEMDGVETRSETVQLEATEYSKIADELIQRMR